MAKRIRVNDSGFQVKFPPTDPKFRLSQPELKDQKEQQAEFDRLRRVDHSLLKDVLKQEQKETDKRQRFESRMDRHKVIFKIQRYLSSKRFGPYLEQGGVRYTSVELTKMNEEQLEDALARIKAKLSSKGAQFFENMVKAGSVTLEKALHQKYCIDGFTECLWEQPDFLDCLEEIKIDMDFPQLPPHLRIGLIVLQTMSTCYYLNNREKMSNTMKQPYPLQEEPEDMTKRELLKRQPQPKII